MIDTHEVVIDSVIADEASRRLGKSYSKEQIGRVRRSIGLSLRQIVARDTARRIASLLDETFPGQFAFTELDGRGAGQRQ